MIARFRSFLELRTSASTLELVTPQEKEKNFEIPWEKRYGILVASRDASAGSNFSSSCQFYEATKRKCTVSVKFVQAPWTSDTIENGIRRYSILQNMKL